MNTTLNVALAGLLSLGGLTAFDAVAASSPTAATAECERVAQPDTGDLEVAPDSRRVDLCMPTFSHPTQITNPLFPVSSQQSGLLVGQVDGRAFRTEVTLLDHTRVIPWAGRQVEVAVSQYVAFLGGRIHEVAYDLYAQDDAGNVWYFGEDVYNFRGGAIGDTHGTWIAGIDGPAAMIMPAAPRPGDVYRPENIPGLVFEEVTVKETGLPFRGPLANGTGALLISELHMDGAKELKTFAPGYGEFFTSGGGDTEALALAVPADAAAAPLTRSVRRLNNAAMRAYAAAMHRSPAAVGHAATAARRAWQEIDRREVPRLLRPLVARGIARLAAARETVGAAQAALGLARLAQDLRLRYESADRVDRLRFDTWLAQMLLDARRGRLGAVSGDFFAIDYVRDRVRDSFDEGLRADVDLALEELLDAINEGDLGSVREVASELRRML